MRKKSSAKPRQAATRAVQTFWALCFRLHDGSHASSPRLPGSDVDTPRGEHYKTGKQGERAVCKKYEKCELIAPRCLARWARSYACPEAPPMSRLLHKEMMMHL